MFSESNISLYFKKGCFWRLKTKRWSLMIYLSLPGTGWCKHIYFYMHFCVIFKCEGCCRNIHKYLSFFWINTHAFLQISCYQNYFCFYSCTKCNTSVFACNPGSLLSPDLPLISTPLWHDCEHCSATDQKQFDESIYLVCKQHVLEYFDWLMT